MSCKCQSSGNQNITVPIPVDPLILRGRAYYANWSADIRSLEWQVDSGGLSPAEGLAAARWLSQVGFYKSVRGR